LPTVLSTIRWNRGAHLKTEKSSRRRGTIPRMIPLRPQVLREVCAAGRLCKHVDIAVARVFQIVFGGLDFDPFDKIFLA